MTNTSTFSIYGLFCACRTCRAERPGEIRYVGQTTRHIEDRLWEHKKNAKAMRGDYPVYRWIVKHGPENIRTFLLDQGDDLAQINQTEYQWIARLQTYRNGRGLNSVLPGNIPGIIAHRAFGAKLTDAEVADIKSRLWSGEPAVAIASDLGLTNSQVFSIKAGRSYRDVPWPIGPMKPSEGPERHRQSQIGSTWSESQREKFNSFLKGWDSNPFATPTPEQWKRSSKLSLTKLKIRDIRRIRALRAEGYSYREIVEQMPEYVTRSIVSHICLGKRWAWVP